MKKNTIFGPDITAAEKRKILAAYKASHPCLLCGTIDKKSCFVFYYNGQQECGDCDEISFTRVLDKQMVKMHQFILKEALQRDDDYSIICAKCAHLIGFDNDRLKTKEIS